MSLERQSDKKDDPNAMEYARVVALDRVAQWEKGACIASTPVCTGDEYRLAKAFLALTPSAIERTERSGASALSGIGKPFEKWWPTYRASIHRRDEYGVARDAWLAGYEYRGTPQSATGPTEEAKKMDEVLSKLAPDDERLAG